MPYGDADNLGLQTAGHLALDRCPHCNTANPTIPRRVHFHLRPLKEAFAKLLGPQPAQLQWQIYGCDSCGGLIAAGICITPQQASFTPQSTVRWLIPSAQVMSAEVPPAAKKYLVQARETLASPSASVVMSASAVDAMLKERGYKEGKLYSRIEKAEKDHVLTEHMADWAHDIRLDANDERHADEQAQDATPEDAARCLEFADALAELLFILPARVKRGRALKTPAQSA